MNKVVMLNNRYTSRYIVIGKDFSIHNRLVMIRANIYPGNLMYAMNKLCAVLFMIFAYTFFTEASCPIRDIN